VLFYNLGSTSLQVSIAEFSSQVVPDGFKKNKTISGFEVLSKAWDASLGGAKFDLRLAEHLAAEFSEKLGEDVRQLPRPMAKIRAQAKKTKIVLSANEQIPVVMQSLYKDMDFFTSMTRSKLEEICKDLFAQAMKPVEQALEKAGLKKDDIHEIEIIGGGVRMPKIQQQLKDFFEGKDLGVHLNGDEAMALGAAFHAANLSNSFRVRHVGMTDIAPYAVGVRLVDIDHTGSDDSDKHWVKRASLFTESSKLGLRKAVSFLHSKDISATFRYDKPSSLPVGASSHIAKFNITGIEEFATKFADKNLGEPKVSLTFELDGSGVTKIAKAEATLEEEYEVEVEVKKEKKKDAKKDKKKDAKKEDGAEDEEKEDEKKDEKEEEKKEEEEPVEKVKQIKKKTHRAVLLVVQAYEKWDHESGISVLPMSVTEKKDSMRMLREMELADNQRRANLEAKNKLESYVYTARDTLGAQEEEFMAVTTSEQLEKLRTKLEETEEWLYDEGEKVSAAEYNKKVKSLDTDFSAILFRISEKKDFPAAVSNAEEYAFSTKELMAEWIESKPQVTEDERKDVLDKVTELEAWLVEAGKKKASAAAHEAPTVTSAEVEKKVQGVKKLVSTLSKKPKPKPAKTEEDEKKEKMDGDKEDKKDKEGDAKKEDAEKKDDKEDDKEDLEAHEEL
jgi:hypoxia up-regulated 1